MVSLSLIRIHVFIAVTTMGRKRYYRRCTSPGSMRRHTDKPAGQHRRLPVHDCQLVVRVRHHREERPADG
jgi:hypothetical protein